MTLHLRALPGLPLIALAFTLALLGAGCGSSTTGSGEDEEDRRGDGGSVATRDIGSTPNPGAEDVDAGAATDAAPEDSDAADTGSGETGADDAGASDASQTDAGGSDAPDTSSADTDPVDSGAVCGDGRVEGAETCDDGNRTSGDGCDAACQRELPDLCNPCTVNIECGGQLDYCVEGFCAAACREGCPTGTTCVSVPVGLETIEQCISDAPCEGAAEQCANGRDDDGDRLVDCDDPDCVGDPSCSGPGIEICDNGRDDDGDRLVDCDDPDCSIAVACSPPELCTNGVDDDGDRLVDCDDPDCAPAPACSTPDVELCTNGVDDDGDRLVDCDDPDCAPAPACSTPDVELCTNGVDDDGDRLVDCDDPDCAASPVCDDPVSGATCAAPAPATLGGNAGTLVAGVGPLGGICGGSGNEEVWAFVAPEARTYCADTFGSTFDTVLYARTVCTSSSSEEACNDDSGPTTQSEIEFRALAGETIYLIVDAYYSYGGGAYTLTVGNEPCDDSGSIEICDDGIDNDDDFSTDCRDSDCDGDPACVEVCDDGIDNDDDFYADCRDSDCEGDPACIETLCDDGIDNDDDFYADCYDPDCDDSPACRPGGTVCEDARSLSVGSRSDDVGSGDSRMSGTCGGNGAEHAWTFVAPRSGSFCFDTRGSSLDTVLYAREDCGDEGSQVACNDDTDGGASELELTLSAGETVTLFVDAYSAFTSVTSYTLNVFDGSCDDAYPEICDDGVDNDDDFYIDCRDPDCDADPACIEICDDGVDNDGDFSTDCRDADCDGDPACVEVCDDGVDNDDDFYTDCRDSDCDGDPACAEICDDGVDNDDDFYTDCRDPDCDDDPACRPGGTVCEDARSLSVGSRSDDVGSGDSRMSGTCGGNGAEQAWTFVAPRAGSFCFDTLGSSLDTVLYVREDCSDEDSEIACNDDTVAGTSELELTLSAGETVTVFVDAYSAFTSLTSYTLNVADGSCD